MKQGRDADRVFAIAFLSGLVTLYLALRLVGAFYLPSEKPSWPRYIHVRKGASAEEIADKLVRSGVVRHRYYFLLAAKGTPQPVIDKLSSVIGKALENPKVNETLLAQGIEEKRGTPSEVGVYLADQIRRWGDIVKLSPPSGPSK